MSKKNKKDKSPMDGFFVSTEKLMYHSKLVVPNKHTKMDPGMFIEYYFLYVKVNRDRDLMHIPIKTRGANGFIDLPLPDLSDVKNLDQSMVDDALATISRRLTKMQNFYLHDHTAVIRSQVSPYGGSGIEAESIKGWGDSKSPVVNTLKVGSIISAFLGQSRRYLTTRKFKWTDGSGATKTTTIKLPGLLDSLSFNTDMANLPSSGIEWYKKDQTPVFGVPTFNHYTFRDYELESDIETPPYRSLKAAISSKFDRKCPYIRHPKPSMTNSDESLLRDRLTASGRLYKDLSVLDQIPADFKFIPAEDPWDLDKEALHNACHIKDPTKSYTM